MCFSASASFGVGTALFIAGALTIKKVKQPSQILFASIPTIFAIQQITEGFVWLSLTNSNFEKWEGFSTYLYMFFAQVVWPILVPFSILNLEKDLLRRKILMIFTGLGTSLGMYILYCLFVYPVKAEIRSYHIHYIADFPLVFAWVSAVFYFIPTIISNFISGHKIISLLGIAVFISFLFTKIFYPDYIISIWCFFAAVISVIVLYIIDYINKPLNSVIAKKA